MEKLRINEIIVVEGKYDASTLAAVVDGLIITTGGFGIFTNSEKKNLIRKLGAKRGLLIMCDSDTAGLQIRRYVEKIAQGCSIKHAYIPAVRGKEKRKAAPARSGSLGVEGLPPQLLRAALEKAQVNVYNAPVGKPITHTLLYRLGLSGTPGSAARRAALLEGLGLPGNMSKNTLCRVLSGLYTAKEFIDIVMEKPVLFWDFHGTLTSPDLLWLDAAVQAAALVLPAQALPAQLVKKHLGHACLPWFEIPCGDTRSLLPKGAWWAFCEEKFCQMYEKCGLTKAQAKAAAPKIREIILQPQRYTLQPDALKTLQELYARGYECYILSNNFPELEEVVQALGLRPYFKQVLVSANIGYDKPNIEIFRHARTLVGENRKLWMIGDNPKDDISGGNAAGYVSVAVNGAIAPHAAYSIPNLHALLALLP